MQHGLYENKPYLFLKFPYDVETISLVKRLQDVRWSNTNKAWLVPFKDDAPVLVINFFALKGIKVNYVNGHEPLPKPYIRIKKPSDELEELNQESQEKIRLFKQWMRSRRYSENTIGTYTDALKLFLRFYFSYTHFIFLLH